MKPDTVDYASCANDFESFIFLQNKELERLTSEKNSAGISAERYHEMISQ